MNLDKWQEVLDRIEVTFPITNDGKYDLDEPKGANVEFVEFESPMGLVRLELTTKPKLESTKTSGGSKYGAASSVEKVYSQDEVVRTFAAFREVDGEWEAVDAQGFI